MKKLFCTFLTIIMVMSLAACGETPSKATDKTDTANKIVEENLPSKENKGEKPIVETEVPTEPLETEAVTEPVTEPVVEEVDMGAAPEIINLSELTMDTTYLYHLEDIVIPEEDSFSLLNVYPQLINDTEYTVLNVIIQINDEDPKDFAAYKHTAYTYVPLADAIIEHTELKTMRLTVQYVEVDQVLAPEQTVNLSDFFNEFIIAASPFALLKVIRCLFIRRVYKRFQICPRRLQAGNRHRNYSRFRLH